MSTATTLVSTDIEALEEVDCLLDALELHAARFADGEWELTTRETPDGAHWHGNGATLREAVHDLVQRKARYPAGA
jgi:hypothetical protein